jgi:hypothetical protein
MRASEVNGRRRKRRRAMSLLMIGLVVAVSLVIVPSIVLNIMEHVRNRRDVRCDGVRVMATVIDVQVKQDWRYGEGWYRDAWSGDLKRKKTWQRYYDVTAQWVHPQTGCTYISRTRIWFDDCTSKPVEGGSGIVWFDPNNPERSCLELQAIAEDMGNGTAGVGGGK